MNERTWVRAVDHPSRAEVRSGGADPGLWVLLQPADAMGYRGRIAFVSPATPPFSSVSIDEPRWVFTIGSGFRGGYRSSFAEAKAAAEQAYDEMVQEITAANKRERYERQQRRRKERKG